jgi:hypothetical protein
MFIMYYKLIDLFYGTSSGILWRRLPCYLLVPAKTGKEVIDKGIIDNE